MDARPIGQILLEAGKISERDLDEALNYQREVGGLIGQALVRLGAVAEETLLDALSHQLDLPVIGRDDLPETDEAFTAAAERLDLPVRWLLAKETAIWIEADADGTERLKLLARRTIDNGVLEPLSEAWAGPIDPLLGPNRVLESALSRMQSHGVKLSEDALTDAERLREMAEEAPVIDFVNGVFEDALRERASDIHIEPFEDVFQVRYRIDGVLRQVQAQPRARFDAVASRVKLLSGMDIAERRLPQDGRQSVRFAGQDIDLRVSSLPGAWGESLVLRLLRKNQELPSLEGLGLEEPARSVFGHLLREPNGIVLVTGPTGSGKSTTLYRALERVNDGQRKIVTIEDPVEYDMAGVTQVQARADIGYDFARGLRAILRQDPDIIMIGEIRDGETARIAVQAALTGHLVFSTLHTNTAIAAIERLVDLGVESFLVSASLRGVMGQRLVRRLCAECAAPADPEEVAMAERLMGEAAAAGAHWPEHVRQSAADWRAPVGCDACHGHGYAGRIAVFEAAVVDGAFRDAISHGHGDAQLVRAGRSQGYLTMFEDGLLKARAGQTSIAEVMRVLGEIPTETAPEAARAEA